MRSLANWNTKIIEIYLRLVAAIDFSLKKECNIDMYNGERETAFLMAVTGGHYKVKKHIFYNKNE